MAVRTGKLVTVLVNAACAASLDHGMANFCILCDHFIYGFAVGLLHVVCTLFNSLGGTDKVLQLGELITPCIDPAILLV